MLYQKVFITVKQIKYKQLYIAGSKFDITMTFKTNNGTGTGEIDLVIHTKDGIPLAQSKLMVPQDPGSYNVKWEGTAAPDPNCDPTQGPCEMWLPGNYTAEVGKNIITYGVG